MILAALLLAAFAINLDTTIVNVALPQHPRHRAWRPRAARRRRPARAEPTRPSSTRCAPCGPPSPSTRPRLLTESAALHVEARLRVLELAEHDLPDIVTATASQTARSRRAS
jgi:hypothetical protein